MPATHIDTDRHSADATTVHWYVVDGESYGLAITDDGDETLLDEDGYPIDAPNPIQQSALAEIERTRS